MGRPGCYMAHAAGLAAANVIRHKTFLMKLENRKLTFGCCGQHDTASTGTLASSNFQRQRQLQNCVSRVHNKMSSLLKRGRLAGVGTKIVEFTFQSSNLRSSHGTCNEKVKGDAG